MDQLIELLKQIQEMAGVGIDALKGAKGGEGDKPDGEKPGGPPRPDEGRPPAREDGGKPDGDESGKPGMEPGGKPADGDEGEKKPPFGR